MRLPGFLRRKKKEEEKKGQAQKPEVAAPKPTPGKPAPTLAKAPEKQAEKGPAQPSKGPETPAKIVPPEAVKPPEKTSLKAAEPPEKAAVQVSPSPKVLEKPPEKVIPAPTPPPVKAPEKQAPAKPPTQPKPEAKLEPKPKVEPKPKAAAPTEPRPKLSPVASIGTEEADSDEALAKRFRFLKNVKIRFPFIGTPIPPSWKVTDRYPVNSPFAYAVVAQSPLLSKRYYLDEVPLTKTEAAIYSYLLDALEAELTVPREQVNPRQYFADQARKILLKYNIRVPAASWSKIIYFAERDLVGFGMLDGIMRDPNIEDISIDALSKPLFVYHKGHESLETNITISDEEQMDNIITRLSHMAGKHVSTAFPIVQGTLPGRHRLIATFRREVSPQGSSATIRKFREDPLTIIDMLNLNLMDYRLAAYTWYLMQNRATGIVVGASVDYRTPMLYRENGKVGIAEAGKLIDPYFESGKDGRAYTSGMEVFCFDPKTYETRWSPIQYVYRHKHAGKMLRFRLQTGRNVTVTRDHSIFVLRRGEVRTVHADEVGLGDLVATSKTTMSELLDRSGRSSSGLNLSLNAGLSGMTSRLKDGPGQVLLELDSGAREGFETHSELRFQEVEALEEVDSTSEFVYDVSVPGCENFLAGFGGIFCHNTGAGKTTLMNALITLTRLNTKLVTIEEVQEMNIPHLNWTSLVSRESYAATEEKAGEVGLFELVKAAMRMRPDILCVGEVRGEEAYVLFQAISSVTGDTPVLVRENGEVGLKQIGEVVDRFYPGETERIPVPVKGMDVLTFDKQNRVLFKPVDYVLRHKADEIYDVRYNGGEVRATGSHSVFVFNDECELVSKPVSELTTGDVLASFANSQVPRDYPMVDAESILRSSGKENIVTQKSLPRCPHCGNGHTWRRGRIHGTQRYTCSECRRTFSGERQDLQFAEAMRSSDGTELVSLTNSKAVPKEMRVDERFAKVLGIYMADGCVKHHKGSRTVFCLGTPEKKLFVDDLTGFFSRFDCAPSIDDRGTYAIIEFNHTPLALVFEELCGRKLSEKHVPSFIWTSPPSVVDAFLDGWRADARRTLKGKVESYNSARPDLVNALSWIARLNGRTTIIGERGSKYRSAEISKPGFEQKSKSVPVAPLLKLKKALDSTAWYYGPDSRKLTISKKRAKRALEDILQKKRSPLNWDTARLASKISSMLEGPLIAVPVRSIKKSRFNGFVYDFSVPGTEAFFGGESPVALHNTGHGGICLPPSERLPITINGTSSLLTMKELFDREWDESNVTRNADSEISIPRDELLVPSFDTASNRMQYSKVKRISRREYHGKLLTLKATGGNSGTVTTDHPMMILRQGKIMRIPAKEVRVGDLLSIVDKMPASPPSRAPTKIDLIDEVVKAGMQGRVMVRNVRDLLYARTKGELARIFGCRLNAIDDYRKKDCLPLEKYLMLKDTDRERRSLRYRKSPHQVPAVVPVNGALARLLGFYLAEGSAGKTQVGFSFNRKETDFAQEVRDALASLFGLRSTLRATGPEAIQVIVKDRLLSVILTDILKVGSNSYTKKVPSLAWSMGASDKKDLLDAYFQGDGSAFVGKDARPIFQATTASEDLAYGVYYLMLSIGYHMNVDKRYDNHELTVSGGENFRRFAEEFKAGKKLKGFVIKGNPGAAEKVPIEYVVSRTPHQLLYTKMADGNKFVSREVIDRLGLARPDGIYFSPVQSVEEQDYDGYVYDLFEVDGSHTFVHGFGVLSSNCTLHADDSASAIQRLISEPMNVPKAFLPFLDLVFVVRRIAVPAPGGGFRAVRRVVALDEVVGPEEISRAFRWDPRTDTFKASYDKSPKLEKIAKDNGITMEEIMREIDRRALVLRWVQQKGIRNFRELSPILELYISRPEEVFKTASAELEAKGVAVAEIMGDHKPGGQPQ